MPNSLDGLDLTCTFDADLRDVPHAPQDMESACDLLTARLSEEGLEQIEQVKMLGQLGVFSRMLGRLEAAQGYLEQAVALSTQLDDKRQVLVNGIRLAHVYQWQLRFEKADALFMECLRRCEGDPDLTDYIDFACQHYGKSLFDQGQYEEADAMFRRALDIRMSKGDRDLIESTQLALQATQARFR